MDRKKILEYYKQVFFLQFDDLGKIDQHLERHNMQNLEKNKV